MIKSFAGTFINNEAIFQALRKIPKNIHKYLDCHWFIVEKEINPASFNLHDIKGTEDGRSYKTTSHAVYPCHYISGRIDEIPSVVLVGDEPPWVVVHELGHVLHWNLDKLNTITTSTTKYSENNWLESFAEAFSCLYCENDRKDYQINRKKVNPDFVGLMESI